MFCPTAILTKAVVAGADTVTSAIAEAPLDAIERIT